MRIFLHILLPLLTPVLLYALWAKADARRKGRGMPGWEEGHWFWVILFGAGLSIASVVWLGMNPADTGGDYRAPRVEDGQVVPGQFDDKK